jgi:uncharacterized protein
LQIEWYAWVMQGAPQPKFLRNRVAYYVMGAERWRYADTLESITANVETLYLQSTGRATDVFRSGFLGARPLMGRGPDQYVYDPRDRSYAELESLGTSGFIVDQRRIYEPLADKLIYHSDPFTADREISGFFRVSAWIAINQADTDFRVAVYEIALEGTSILLSSDLMRARYRNSRREATLVQTSEPLHYDFRTFTFVSRQIRKGCRLRLVIGALNSIYSQKNYNSGGLISQESLQDSRSVTVSLFHDEAHPSALYIPYGHPET